MFSAPVLQKHMHKSMHRNQCFQYFGNENTKWYVKQNENMFRLWFFVNVQAQRQDIT